MPLVNPHNTLTEKYAVIHTSISYAQELILELSSMMLTNFEEFPEGKDGGRGEMGDEYIITGKELQIMSNCLSRAQAVTIPLLETPNAEEARQVNVGG